MNHEDEMPPEDGAIRQNELQYAIHRALDYSEFFRRPSREKAIHAALRLASLLASDAPPCLIEMTVRRIGVLLQKFVPKFRPEDFRGRN